MTPKLIAALLLLSVCSGRAESFPVRIKIDAAEPGVLLKPIWRFFGADEPNYTYMKDGSELLGQLGALKKDEVFSALTACWLLAKGSMV